MDSHSIKTTEIGGERGFDGSKKFNRRKQAITVDTAGFLPAVAVTTDSVGDAKAARPGVTEQHAGTVCGWKLHGQTTGARVE
ncbi:transposase [Zavarzinella formosa]|uniref:transposase n=1 Tax=Zavarzinella formosa TaxID=360055 RepID=UPI0036F1F09A